MEYAWGLSIPLSIENNSTHKIPLIKQVVVLHLILAPIRACGTGWEGQLTKHVLFTSIVVVVDWWMMILVSFPFLEGYPLGYVQFVRNFQWLDMGAQLHVVHSIFE